MNTERLVTVSEIAEILRVPKSWIYARTSMGKDAIPYVKFGKYVRFRVSEVLQFFENQNK